MVGDTTFQWLGTAGFKVTHGDAVFLIDPYLTRNERARPVQELAVQDMSDAGAIFLSHGHFDHAFDVPAIAAASGADVYASERTCRALERRGVPAGSLHPLRGGESLDLDSFRVRINPGRHTRFDLKLIMGTAPGVLRELKVFREFRGMSAGKVLIHTFDFGGPTFTHLGSMGIKPSEVSALGLVGADVLALPLQGHTEICERAAMVTAAVRPRVVIPEHHDDFFPPLSRSVDIRPFERRVAELLPNTACYVPELNREFSLGDLLGMA
jgi:L-ascorbate metabolism protein UlaG (beta-lactamase superfamily)